jgi:hypothetical protein
MRDLAADRLRQVQPLLGFPFPRLDALRVSFHGFGMIGRVLPERSRRAGPVPERDALGRHLEGRLTDQGLKLRSKLGIASPPDGAVRRCHPRQEVGEPGERCHGSAYTGQSRVGVIRPAEPVGDDGWSRHIPASAESA